ncbi:aquaporin AQPAe.a-like [Haliotis rubra]|uniref:aquaporin AQPAe.a-like n=1 Tax=Haliotis rubra TaxID=36100 RepID=UPI001EE5E400|nr:aquaporin AQPAe.a-like [Haliotis rubra]
MEKREVQTVINTGADDNDKCSCSGRIRSLFSTEDINRCKFFQELAAEFLGSALLVIFGCGSAVTLEPNLAPTVPSIAIAFGLTVATIIWSLGHVSGAQINPCVTLTLCLTRKMTLIKCALYCVIQCVGAIAGAYILYGLTPEDRRGMLGITLVSPRISLWQGVGVEILATFMLVLAIYATIDSRITDHPGSKALSIGFVVTMDIPWAIQYTGASMNPARSLGPVVVMGVWDHHWVFWLGPILGALAAGFLYETVFAVNASVRKTRTWVCGDIFDEDRMGAYELRTITVDNKYDVESKP